MPDRSPISEKPIGLQMSLPARAENVAVVRHALAGLGEEIGMDEAAIADLKTVVTEACMNVVVHAYQGDPGPLTVEAEPDTEGMTVVVRDTGVGIQPRADVEQSSLRLGLSLIAALSSSFSISGGVNRGTEIAMRLPLQGKGPGEDGDGARATIEPPSDATEIVVGRSELLAPVLARVVGALAARRDLSIDRLSDAVLVTDAIAAAAPGSFSDGAVRLALADGEDGIELRLGPMQDGAAERIRAALAVPDVGGSLEALADELVVDDSTEGDYLAIRFSPVPAP
jgi:anti-sigma regulatory factor (Ser/Thr protein kinase)